MLEKRVGKLVRLSFFSTINKVLVVEWVCLKKFTDFISSTAPPANAQLVDAVAARDWANSRVVDEDGRFLIVPTRADYLN